MRKIAVLLASLVLCVGGLPVKAAGNVSGRLASLASQYSQYEDFEVVRIGPFLMKMIKMTAGKELDAADEGTWAMLNGVKSLVVVEYEEAPDRIVREFNARASRILSESDVLMEAKGDGDVVKIYGTVSSDSRLVSDLVVYVPNDCTLICISGTVPMDEVKKVSGS